MKQSEDQDLRKKKARRTIEAAMKSFLDNIDDDEPISRIGIPKFIDMSRFQQLWVELIVNG